MDEITLGAECSVAGQKYRTCSCGVTLPEHVYHDNCVGVRMDRIETAANKRFSELQAQISILEDQVERLTHTTRSLL